MCCSSTVSSERQVENFRTRIPDIQNKLWDCFRSFASSALPRKFTYLLNTHNVLTKLVKDNCLATTAATPFIKDSTPEQSTSEHTVDIPSSPRAEFNNSDDSETMIGTPSPALTKPDNESEISASSVAAINMFQVSNPVHSSTPLVDSNCTQPLNLTDEQMALAIASALSAVSAPDGPAITPEQAQPPKAQRKHHALKKVVITPSSAEQPAVSTARPVKRKRQATKCVPPIVGPPTKKIKTPLEAGKRVSAR